MTPQEYQQRAVALESKRDDTGITTFPTFNIAQMIAVGRRLDLVKRECFYDKKPDQDKMEEANQVGQDAFEVALRHQATGELNCNELPIPASLFHALLGLTTEVGELWEAVLNAVNTGKPFDLDNLLEEAGDLEWYQALLRETAEKLDGARGRFTQEAIQRGNIAKLETRYKRKEPDGSHTYGGERNLQAEHDAMNAAALGNG